MVLQLTGACFPKRHVLSAPEAVVRAPGPLVPRSGPGCGSSFPVLRFMLVPSRLIDSNATFSVSLRPAAGQMPGPVAPPPVLPSANISCLKKKTFQLEKVVYSHAVVRNKTPTPSPSFPKGGIARNCSTFHSRESDPDPQRAGRRPRDDGAMGPPAKEGRSHRRRTREKDSRALNPENHSRAPQL